MFNRFNKKKPKEYSTNELLEGIRNHDSEVLQHIFEKYQNRVIRFITSNKGTRQEGEDIFMDAMEVMFRKVQDQNFKLSHAFYTYFYEICRRLWLRKLRRKKFDSDVTIDDYKVQNIVDEAQPAIEKTEQYRLFRDKIALLGEMCQQLLRLALEEGKKAAEIMVIMNISSEGNVRKRKHGCKKKLIQLIKQDQRFKELIQS